MIPPLFLLFGYAFGSVPFGLLLTRAAGLGDIRAIGSGNIGATNVLRTGNKKLAAATLLLDALKGTAAVLLAAAVAGPEAALWAGAGAMLGHLFPVWLGFKGGKGVATAYGVLFGVAWPVGLAAGAIWLIMAAISRMSSVAALTAFAAAPLLAWQLADPGVLKLSFILGVLVWIRHHANIRRILSGTEPRIGRSSAPKA